MNKIHHHKKKQQFELQLESGHSAIVDYVVKNDKLYLTHSEVPGELRGQGVGKELVEKTFELLTEEGYQAKALCSYIRAVAMRSKKWKNIIEY